MLKSFGFSGLAYNQVIVFQSAEMLQKVLESNPNMEPIIGTGQGMETDFPGVYIAGIRANLPMDNKADGRGAIQK